ncbi:heat shock protein 70, putative [Entamoeba histolytica HM-1:IMSS-B]|uniref:Heat shock protein 70, putative n=6 Tax=Entamoeba histolytica TaxID=5759 RepID=C4MAM2_ENTH1|nr:heat shock protein 70, putative [Entamoeba histolytica HM-1:IMSS]EMD46259.1 heat shock protein, putative [Entamoeba histolytica KU27]EMH73907.1 heat shock protein 70, putative [Entamoeba histolytica HM-1:IMSS-B]EMS11126.1 heat shock protein 70, putative [Entamoeba histolytica HM-3:IMSS]ENY64425.1 heat shock protein 70, putative [Entamoeba histolytica HM-1:IMSS-A]GAT98867.1 heat shock protein 70 putative [Entamoeba histolytica]|eukprot:XP_647850.1 heat shock protein 70, putative [Entamoeba histolytica HM-1:IMSS]
MTENKFVGIDFGTTYSSIGYCVGKTGKINIIQDDNSSRFIPSTIEISNGEITTVGVNPIQEKEGTQILSDSKTFLGKTLQGIKKEQQQQFIEKGGEIFYRINDPSRLISVKTVAKSILKKLKDLYCEKVKIDKNTTINPVITIPAGFNHKQRQVISHIANEININPTFIHEPTAAALYYLDITKDKIENPTKLLVFDFGGGTLDITCIEMKLNTEGKPVFNILCTNGNNELGGNNFDENLYKAILSKIEQRGNIKSQTMSSQEFKQKLRNRVISAKYELSQYNETTIVIPDPDISDDDSTFDENEIKVTREFFDDINSSEYKKAMDLIDGALDMAKLQSNDIDKVLLVGGSSCIPKVKDLIQKKFGIEKIIQGINPLTAVVLGAVTYSREKCVTINEVLPKDIKIERFDGTTITIFKANEKLPLKRTISITPSEDNVENIKISLYEGNYSVASMNDLIDEIIFSNLAKVSIDDAYIEMTFECDKSGSLKISVIDFNNDVEQQVQIRTKINFTTKQEVFSSIEEHLQFINSEDKKNPRGFAIVPVTPTNINIGSILYK